VTHVDKASKFLLAGLAKDKTVEQINQVTLTLFEPIAPGVRKTMTFDNGKEFCGHQTLSIKLGVECFFANPYHSWERGLNEHTNESRLNWFQSFLAIHSFGGMSFALRNS
jgi:IS30 family transposase